MSRVDLKAGGHLTAAGQKAVDDACALDTY